MIQIKLKLLTANFCIKLLLGNYPVNPSSNIDIISTNSVMNCNWTRTDNHLVRKQTPISWVFVYEPRSCVFESSCSHLTSYFAPVASKDFLDIQATIECGFTLKRVRDIIRTYSQCNERLKHSSTFSFSQIEAVVQRSSVVKVLLEISQNSQENTCTRASFLIKLQASGLQLY